MVASNTPPRKIFISWSGNSSMQFAQGLKYYLENEIFEDTGLSCFVSDLDIASGDDWWKKIKSELESCNLCIICITKENYTAPWLYYEAGAVATRGVYTIPLLINCSKGLIKDTPLSTRQAVEFHDERRPDESKEADKSVEFHDERKFIKMLKDINNRLGLGLTERTVALKGKEAFHNFKKSEEYAPLFSKLRTLRTFHPSYVYPRDVTNIKLKSVYISVPMSSITNSAEYEELRKCILDAVASLRANGFTDVFCPMVDIDSPRSFNGESQAIKNNYPAMKRAENMLVVYPKKIASSVLVEVGYGIALSKNIVLFHKGKLPFILRDASNSIDHVKTIQYRNSAEIVDRIQRDGKSIFMGSSTFPD